MKAVLATLLTLLCATAQAWGPSPGPGPGPGPAPSPKSAVVDIVMYFESY